MLWYRGHLSSNNSRKTPHSSPVRARYGVSIVSARSDWSFTNRQMLHCAHHKMYRVDRDKSRAYSNCIQQRFVDVITYPRHDIAFISYTEAEMLSCWWNFRHWLHWNLSKWRISVHPVTKMYVDHRFGPRGQQCFLEHLQWHRTKSRTPSQSKTVIICIDHVVKTAHVNKDQPIDKDNTCVWL